jgi:hypothetical protein
MPSDAWRSNVTTIDTYRAIGSEAIQEAGTAVTPLPWNFTSTVFRCAWEYPVADFEAEVGFYLQTLGFSTLALDGEYALFTTPENDLTFACRRHRSRDTDYRGHILCFMTRDLETFAASLEDRVGEGSVQRVDGSTVQTVLRVFSPAGLRIDIWEFPS